MFDFSSDGVKIKSSALVLSWLAKSENCKKKVLKLSPPCYKYGQCFVVVVVVVLVVVVANVTGWVAWLLTAIVSLRKKPKRFLSMK